LAFRVHGLTVLAYGRTPRLSRDSPWRKFDGVGSSEKMARRVTRERP
jgi:hypothetical protein